MSVSYLVKPGDCLSVIARDQGITLGELLVANPQFSTNGRNPDLIYPGETVSIPSKSRFDTNQNLMQGSQECAECPTCTLAHAARNPECAWGMPTKASPVVIEVGRSEQLLANITPEAKRWCVSFGSTNPSAITVEPDSADSAPQQLTVTAGAAGDGEVLAECEGNPLASYALRAVEFQTPLLVAWSDRRPGLNAQGTDTADDMKFGDYTAEQIEAVDWTFRTLELRDMRTASASSYFRDLRAMAKSLFAMGDLEDNIESMIDHFEGNTGNNYSSAILNDAVRDHDSPKRFLTQIRNELERTLTSARGDLNALATPGVMSLIGRPRFNTWDDRLSGLTIAINDTWAYDVYVEDYILEAGCWKGQFRVVLWDHFGLDEPDVNESKSYDWLNGFRSWFILQHLDRFAYRPFKTKIELSGFDFDGHL